MTALVRCVAADALRAERWAVPVLVIAAETALLAGAAVAAAFRLARLRT